MDIGKKGGTALDYGGYAMRKMLLPSEVANPQKLKIYNNKHDKRIEVVW